MRSAAVKYSEPRGIHLRRDCDAVLSSSLLPSAGAHRTRGMHLIENGASTERQNHLAEGSLGRIPLRERYRAVVERLHSEKNLEQRGLARAVACRRPARCASFRRDEPIALLRREVLWPKPLCRPPASLNHLVSGKIAEAARDVGFQ